MGSRRPVGLIVLDGWGIAPPSPGNAVSLASTPYWHGLTERWPMARLRTDGQAVGLTDGQMGNSNVGHLNIGAGRIVFQDLPRISRAIARGELAQIPALQELRKAPRLHLMGLLSPGGVHSHIDHAIALLHLYSGQAVYVHAFLDGRDVPPQSAGESLARLEAACKETGAQIATLCGRFYAMDRDRRFERTEKAYTAIVRGEGRRAPSAEAALEAAYARDETDEFLEPTVLGGYEGARPGDAFFFWNFRSDRARQISRAIADPEFSGFPRPEAALPLVAMTEYDQNFHLPVAFPPHDLHETLGEVVSRAGLRQLRVAETEKYAHVTYFFNGGREEPFPGEERILVPSPKVTTYDAAPEMSAAEVTEQALQQITKATPDLFVLNYANADMVGHTGSIEAAVRAVEAVDRSLKRLVPAVLERGGTVLLIADHGNAEEMLDSRGGPQTSHSLNLVPVLLAGASVGVTLADGILADVAPTVLELLEVPQPAAMTGKSILRKGTGK
ncbi:MAG: 2,3-bisphosphoglycerate-independent phosphoglycerate mutase [Thermaerobacter sp.]|nr:2,3-bisphosphoglycerate-independent phosphoglycerate mutase [Thermaerobacter sp.]